MGTFCDCETCQMIKRQIAERTEPLCPFCGNFHPVYATKDSKHFCPFNIPGKDEFIRGGMHQPWATSQEIPDEKDR